MFKQCRKIPTAIDDDALPVKTYRRGDFFWSLKGGQFDALL